MNQVNTLEPHVEVVKFKCNPFASKNHYLRKIENNVNKLREKNQQLTDSETDIKRKLEGDGEDQAKEGRERVSLLLEDVLKIKLQVSGIEGSLEENRNCFCDYWSHRKLSKHIVKVGQEVNRLLGETSQFVNELVEQSPPRALALPTAALVGKSTVERNVDSILKALRNPMIGKIGIYGMGGSGKTMTMMNIHNQLIKTKEFNKIVWVTVSKDLNLNKHQNLIAEQLNLDLSKHTDEVQKADRIFERLQQSNKFLIILDDMWDQIPLEKLGIPEPTEENKCKMVLTTRSLAVCRSMESQENIRLELLSEEEAWELFVSKAGDQIAIKEVQPFAAKVVRECNGLPLAIITVGRAMRNEVNIRLWRQTVKDLQASPTEIRGMEEHVFKLLRFSYSRMRNDTIRKCFLFSGLFPEDFKIESKQLIRYWMAENLIIVQGDYLETEKNIGFEILKELVDTCMLEFVQSRKQEDYCVRVHDSIRDLAITIMDEEGSLVKAGLALTKSPSENEWLRASKLSLMNNQIQVLPGQPNCPSLSTLLLRENPLLQNISCSFFSQMPALEVLDLSGTNVIELPSSLSDLLNLRALYLQGCMSLEKIPSLAKLKKLQTLDLSYTAIKETPQGMEGLISLRSLDLSHTRHLENCVFPTLAPLEELLMLQSNILWKDPRSVTECIKEIGCLDSLVVLTMTFLQLENYFNAVQFLPWEKLNNFHITILSVWGRIEDTLYGSVNPNKCVEMFNQMICSYGATLTFPPNTHQIYLEECKIPPLSGLSYLRNLKFIKECSIHDCTLMWGDSLILGEEMEECPLTSLDYLYIREITRLKVLWRGVVPHSSLPNLKVLEVWNCEGLKSLFFVDLLQHLKNIEKVEVMDCGQLEAIVVDTDGEGQEIDATDGTDDTTRFVLPKLHTLTIQNLPKLQTISTRMWVCISLRHVDIFQCPKLKCLPFSDAHHNLLKLEVIKGETVWWEGLEWDDADTKCFLQSRFKHKEKRW